MGNQKWKMTGTVSWQMKLATNDELFALEINASYMK